ncbi:MAG: inner rane hydrolase, partial [Chloroflexi bacterium]|nr:inner rane hydrolase [Chloroflexota bacterium]
TDLFTAIYTVAVYLTYSWLYLAPAVIVIKTADALLRPLHRPSGSAATSATNRNWVVFSVAVVSLWLTQVCLMVDKEVFTIFGMHLNGFVWNTVFTAGGLEAMGGSTATNLTYAAILLGLLVVQVLPLAVLWKIQLLQQLWRVTFTKRMVIAYMACFVLSVLGEIIAYGVSDIRSYSPLLASATLFPLYQPVTFRTLARRLGFNVDRRDEFRFRTATMRLNYPIHTLRVNPPEHPLNIVWLVAESLRADVLDPEVMPQTWAFARRAHCFGRHYSGGNGTRMGMFTMFYGLYGNYWFPFLQERRSPIVMDVLQDQGYQLRLFTSARFSYPEFNRTIFARVPGDRMLEDSGGPGWSRDRRNVDRILDFIHSRDPSKPFMTFMFFESPHAQYHFPPEAVIRTPYLEEFNYVTADLHRDMPLIKNRYINSCYHLDPQVGRILTALEHDGLLESTIVLFTGDHGEEFMEKGRWGHNSEFSEEQLRVPMVLWIPGTGSSVSEHITSHLDIVPTLLPFLGVVNPPDEVSLGASMLNGPPRAYTIAGDWSRLTYIDDEYKASFPLEIGGVLRNCVTDQDDAPVADAAAFYSTRRPRLLEVMKDLHRFGR